MNCPQCNKDAAPSEIDREAELAMYECEDCLTSWHVDFGRVLRGEGAPAPLVQDGSMLWYLVTNESTGSQTTVSGWRKAVQAMSGYLERHVEHHGTYSVVRPQSLDVELSASPDPEYRDGSMYMPHFHINAVVSYNTNEELAVGEQIPRESATMASALEAARMEPVDVLTDDLRARLLRAALELETARNMHTAAVNALDARERALKEKAG